MTAWRVLAAIVPLLMASLAVAGPCGAPNGPDHYQLLDDGYRSLYDLDFNHADRVFVQWETDEPQNPLGPASRASGYLFQEFERLGVLRSELFTDDQAFEARNILHPDERLKLLFQQQLMQADRLAGEMLAEDPSSSDAFLAKTRCPERTLSQAICQALAGCRSAARSRPRHGTDAPQRPPTGVSSKPSLCI